MAKSTVHRLLRGLSEAGFVASVSEGRYRLGRELIRLGELSRRTNREFNPMISSLSRLATYTGDSAFYAERRGTVSVCLWREDGNGPFRNNILSVGDIHPLGITAGSLAILAQMPKAEADECMAENLMTFPPDSKNGAVLRSDMFCREYEAARENGWALNTGWWVEDSWAVGVAVPGSCRSGGGASLSITTIRTRLQEPRLSQVVAALRSEAELLASKSITEGDFCPKPG